ncbi:hypothetical protein LCGC14_2595820, partial [marine sediment metagenome]
LDVKMYQTGQSRATISRAGLNQRDGLPNEYIGEIMYLIEGYDEFYALVDSSQSIGTTTSGVYASNGRYWRNLWIDVSTEGAMTSGILTTSPSVLLLFDCGSTTYKIPIQRTFQNPKKDSTYTYAASAVHISPWFDADTAVYDKLAKAINTYAKDITANETVAIKYRTNKTNTDIATGWTTLDTLNTSGENGQNEEKLGTNAGEVIETIQLRLDLARGGTTTLAPDVQAVVLAYQKLIDQIWSWSFRLIIDDLHNTKAKQKAENLITAIESQTIIPFIFRQADSTETKYVKLFSPQGTSETGNFYMGDYVLIAVEI